MRTITSSLLLVGVLLAGACVTRLQAQEPAELVKQIYAPYLKPDEESPLPPLLSEEAASDGEKGYLAGALKKAVAALTKAQEENEELSLGYDPLIDGQDFEITDFKTSAGGKEAEVKADFKNFGEKRSYLFRFEKAAGDTKWRLAKVECTAGSDGRTFDLQKEIEETLAKPTE